MSKEPSRHIELDFVGNLRDLGGYKTQTGRKVAWGKLFRSSEPKPDNSHDVTLLKETVGISSVLDLRGSNESSQERIALFAEQGIRYQAIPLIAEAVGMGFDDETGVLDRISNLADFYLMVMINRRGFAERLANALEFIADPENQPVLFHCALGKDRTGILAAALLDILGVGEEDIMHDYHLTSSYMPGFIDDLVQTPHGKEFYDTFPSYMWDAQKESIKSVLAEITNKYGSFRNFLAENGCEPSLFSRLENTLLDGTE
ncbi:MAG: tyrosine-protein phosphatase [Dehalococcoidales bacterium]|nr:tyrosine-protein phosphatase [Dehalococcoidales bacterium]